MVEGRRSRMWDRIGLGMHKVQLLLDQHKCSDCVGMKASAPE